MQGLVGDLLLLAQVDEGAAPPPMERLDLTDLVEGELLQFESVAFERAVDLQSQLDESVMAVSYTHLGMANGIIGIPFVFWYCYQLSSGKAPVTFRRGKARTAYIAGLSIIHI